MAALEHNAQQIRQFVPKHMAVMAVVKADAYGHGTVMVLPTLEASGIAMAGVAAMDEALQIRQAGFTLPVLVLGATPDWALQYAVENDIQLTVFSHLHLEGLARLYEITRQPVQVQIKVDTGMHRIGVPWEQAAAFIGHCQSLLFLDVQGIFTHLSHTGDAAFTQCQLDRWKTVVQSLNTPPPLRHVANSSGMWHFPLEDSVNMVRVGIALFGYAGDEQPLPFPLKPVMGLKARIVHLHELPPGEWVSYNRTFQNQTDGPRVLATLPLGYADGVPRLLSNRIAGLYQGQCVPQVGAITMDQLMVDVTDVADARVGDVMTLIGESNNGAIWLTDWAAKLGTIEYELMCNLRVRLPKTYVRS